MDIAAINIAFNQMTSTMVQSWL